MTYPSDICHMRDKHECGCTGTCRQKTLRTTAPVQMASALDMLAASILIGFIACVIAFVSIPRAADAYHRQALEQQEQISWAR